MYRKNYNRPTRRPIRKVGRKTQRTKRMVDGTDVLSRAERMIRSGASTAQTVATIAKTVGGIVSMINTEQKYVDNAYNNIPIGSVGQFYRLSNIALGDSDSQRNGNQVLMKDLNLKYVLTFPPFGADFYTPTTIRAIVFVDKEFDGTMPTLNSLVENSASVLSSINRDFSKRYVIIKSAVYNLTTYNQQLHDKLHIKIPFHLFFDGPSAADTDAKENQLIFALYSDQDLITGDPPSLNYYSRLNYYDN